MARISQSTIEQIRQQVSIVDVVSPYVQLKQAGASLKGLSPFSSEKTPSFFVNPEKNVFKCFSTGFAGDVFRFLELKEQLSFVEAIEWLAEKFHIPIRYENGSSPVQENGRSQKQSLIQVYQKSSEFFQKFFWQNDDYGKQVQQYWTETRHFSLETAKTFSVGFAPNDTWALYKYLQSLQFPHKLLEDSGLFYRPKMSGAALVCRYQGRLIIPIKDIQGRTIAFSGRQLPFIQNNNDPTREAKYINSPETPIFVKGNQLFNLDLARQHIDQVPYFFLVEGPLDVIRCWECGLKTVVAPQGTGLTEQQLKVLQRYSMPIVGMFDGDSAGIKASLRFMSLGLPLNLQLQYVFLPKDADPDSYFFQQPNAAHLASLIPQSLQPVQAIHKAIQLLEKIPSKVEQETIRFVFDTLRNCSSAILQQDCLHTLAGELGIQLKAVEHDFYAQKSVLPSYEKKDEKPKIAPKTLTGSLEAQLLSFYFNKPEWIAAILKILSLDWVDTSHPAGHLLCLITQDFLDNGIEKLNSIEKWSLQETEREIWYQILVEPFDSENEKGHLETILEQMYKRYLKKCISEIDNKMLKSSNINAEQMKSFHSQRYQLRNALAVAHTSIHLDI